MNPTKLVRISALVLVLFLTALSAYAVPPCGCNYCQRFPERSCTTDGTVTTCAQFLTVALCPAAASAAFAEPAGCLTPTN
jgi:hypothetical protein